VSEPIVLRHAETDDLPAVVYVHAASATAGYRSIFGGTDFPADEAAERWRAFPGAIVVAEVNGQVVGFVAFDDVELHALYVAPSHWRSGLGSRLLRAVPESVERLWVLRDNDHARLFYESRGWRPAGEERSAHSTVEALYRRKR
jgi:GNAT superfamily N-acetyltransferase